MEVNFKKSFTPVTLIINTEVDLATILGALIGYGTANVFAENNLKALGLGEFYSGNVRKGARQLVTQIVTEVGLSDAGLASIVDTYTNSDKFSGSKASQAGSAVIGTEADLAPGYEATGFESKEAADEVDVPDYNDDDYAG